MSETTSTPRTGPRIGRSPTIWMNVTTSERWTRPAVGIVRVEQSLREALTKHYGADRLQPVVAVEGRFRRASRPTASGAPTADAPASGSGPGAMRAGDVLLDVGLDWVRWGADSTRHYERLRKAHGMRVVTFCHDLIPILYPQYIHRQTSREFAEYLIAMTQGSDAVLCNSKQTRRDYLAFCARHRLRAPRAEIVELGDQVPDAAGTVSDAVREAAGSEYILFVSTIERRKNHEVLYRAYHLLAREGHGSRLPKLLLVGMPGWGVAELFSDIALDPLVKGLIVRLDRVNDAELNLLYRNALFCVYPSLYEGWGLPVGEALAMGKLVLCSNRGSLPEVGGDLIPYLDPWHAQSWADAILELLSNREELRRREDAIRTRYRPRTWERAAATVIRVIDDLISPPAHPG